MDTSHLNAALSGNVKQSEETFPGSIPLSRAKQKKKKCNGVYSEPRPVHQQGFVCIEFVSFQ